MKEKNKINFSAVLSIIAILISGASIYLSNLRHSDSSTASVIRDNYQDFFSVHEIRMSYPAHSYLFVSKDDYLDTKTLVKKANSLIDSSEAATHLLVEQALSRRLFSMFEHSYYQWKNAKNNSDEQRTEFLQAVLSYFTNTLLPNPRLAWYWSAKGGNIQAHYEDEVLKYYNKSVQISELDSIGLIKY